MLVANAAHPATGLLSALSQEEIDRMLDVNLRAPIALARALAPAMLARGRGHLVFISSLSGKSARRPPRCTRPRSSACAGFGLALREDLRGTGVGVSVVAPGFIRESGMFANTGVKLPPGVGTKSPQDVAAAVIRAIEHNRAEVDVAPLGLRVGTALASAGPGAGRMGQHQARVGQDRGRDGRGAPPARRLSGRSVGCCWRRPRARR